MISVLNNSSGQDRLPKELEMASALHKKEMDDLRESQTSTVQSLERQIVELKTSNADYEAKLKSAQGESQTNSTKWQARVAELEGKLKEQEEKVRLISEEKKKQREAIELDGQMKVMNLNLALEKLKAEHAKEIERTKQQEENTLKDIKYIYGQEKAALEARLEKAHNELKVARSTKEGNDNAANLQEMQAKYLEEIEELNSHLSSFKQQSQEEVETLKQERDEAVERAMELEKELARASGSIRTMQSLHNKSSVELSQKLEKAKELADANEGVQAEIKKSRKQIADMKAHITKLEANERRLKMMFTQKEANFDAERESMKRKLSAERKKATQSQEGCARAKEDYDRKRVQILQDIVTKDEQIALLNKQVEVMHKEAQCTVSSISSGFAIRVERVLAEDNGASGRKSALRSPADKENQNLGCKSLASPQRSDRVGVEADPRTASGQPKRAGKNLGSVFAIFASACRKNRRISRRS